MRTHSTCSLEAQLLTVRSITSAPAAPPPLLPPAKLMDCGHTWPSQTPGQSRPDAMRHASGVHHVCVCIIAGLACVAAVGCVVPRSWRMQPPSQQPPHPTCRVRVPYLLQRGAAHAHKRVHHRQVLCVQQQGCHALQAWQYCRRHQGQRQLVLIGRCAPSSLHSHEDRKKRGIVEQVVKKGGKMYTSHCSWRTCDHGGCMRCNPRCGRAG